MPEWVMPTIVGVFLLSFLTGAILWLRWKWEKYWGEDKRLWVEEIDFAGDSKKYELLLEDKWFDIKTDGKRDGQGKRKKAEVIDRTKLILQNYTYSSRWPEWAPRVMQVVVRKALIKDGLIEPISKRGDEFQGFSDRTLAGMRNEATLKVAAEASKALDELDDELRELRQRQGIPQKWGYILLIWAVLATVAAIFFGLQAFGIIPTGPELKLAVGWLV